MCFHIQLSIEFLVLEKELQHSPLLSTNNKSFYSSNTVFLFLLVKKELG